MLLVVQYKVVVVKIHSFARDYGLSMIFWVLGKGQTIMAHLFGEVNVDAWVTVCFLHLCLGPWIKCTGEVWYSTPTHDSETILTLNTLSPIKLGLGEVEELARSRMKYSRLYVILLHLVLSAKSVYNFWPGLMALAPHAAPSTTPALPPYI